MAGTTTSQQFRIRDIPAADTHAGCAEPTLMQQRALRERYQGLIARFAPASERASEDAAFAHRRYAKIMAMDSGHHLRAALSMLCAGQQLTSAEVAAIVAGAESGRAPMDDVRALLAQPQQLPAPETAAEIRAYIRESGSRHFEALRRALDGDA